MNHNHVWRDTTLPTPKCSKEELMKSIHNAGDAGWWLKGVEAFFAVELAAEGRIELCCDGKAAKEKAK